MYPYPERLNHISLDSATGHRHIFDDGPTRVNSSIVWKSVHYDVAKKYEEFLLDYAKLGQVPFRIVCPEYIDFGLGKGMDIPVAYYAGPPTLKDIISPAQGCIMI